MGHLLTPLILSLSPVHAGSALPPSAISNNQVVAGEFVPMDAMSPRSCRTPFGMFGARHGFQVSRTELISNGLNAGSVSTQMVQLAALGDGTDQQFVCKPVDAYSFAARASEEAVTVHLATRPCPAARATPAFYEKPDPHLWWGPSGPECGATWISMTSPAAMVGRAQASRQRVSLASIYCAVHLDTIYASAHRRKGFA